jgi:cullin-associated NEDD8-dissociated protein 1
VGRFKEREENCRVDVIDCFTRLLSVTVKASNVVFFDSASDMGVGSGVTVFVVDFRTKYANVLVKACEKLLSGKKGGDRSKSSALSLLSTLCRAPGGVGGEVEILGVMENVKTFLGDGVDKTEGSGLAHQQSISKSLKLEALSLLRVMLSCNKHDPVHIKNGIKKVLLDDLCLAVTEQWYKVIAEALRVLTEVPKFFVTGYTGNEDGAARNAEVTSVATTLYNAIEPLLAASDVDQEIKECALGSSAALLSSLHGSLTDDQTGRMLSLLLEKLGNETTRIAAIKTLSTVASATDEDSMIENAINLSSILGEAVTVMASFLKQQSRSLKQNSLEALDIVVTNHGNEDPALSDGNLLSSVLEDLADLIVDSDLHLSHLSMRVCISTLRVCPACGPAAKAKVLPPALVLSTSSLLQEPALESLLILLEQMIVSTAVDFSELSQMLHEKSTQESVGKHAIANLAKCIAVVTAAAATETRKVVVASLLTSLEGVGSPTEPSQIRQVVLNLLVSGDLGRVVDYSTMDGSVERIQAIYLACFDSSSEEIKHAGSYALGRAAIGSKSVLLPAIVSTLEESDQKKQYLLLSALREFIQCQLKDVSNGLSSTIPVILPHLLNHTSDAEEGARTMVAECLGSLTCVQPVEMLETLQKLVNDHSQIVAEGGHVAEDDETSKKNALICWTAATSVKHAIAGKAPVNDLSSAMPVFLELLKQEEVSVRNAALLMVYSSVHHMPKLVSPFMKDIMPSLYQVAELKLTRVVDLGPFKHTVDDALPMRKSAMSIFATCLEKLPGSMDIAAFMPILASSLGDLEDVQLQAHHIVITAAQKHPTYLVAALDNFVPEFETMFMDKTYKKKTANKTGTELERAKEWIKSGLRALLAMSKLEGAMANRRFSALVERVKGDAKFRPMLDAIEEER